MNNKAPLYYVEANQPQLMLDIAPGKGEYLEAFARTLGCSDDSVAIFKRSMQANYDQLARNQSLGNFLIQVKGIVHGQKGLHNHCHHAILI